MPDCPLPSLSPETVRHALRERREIALVDVREEDDFARGHPLFAAQLSASRLEIEALWRLPRRDVTVAVYDDGEGLADAAARRLQALGFSRVHLLAGGLQGWRDSGGELFRDVNAPSKAFGEWVEHERRTPLLAADEVKALLDRGADVVVLDVRRFDEYQTMSIPTAISVPGAELLLHVRDLAPDPATRVIVNCAGRTRSIVGTQTLVNAGIANPVAGLRNGTIGWTLAGLALEHGQSRCCGAASAPARRAARIAAQALAERAGALRLDGAGLARWRADASRTLYCWDVRSAREYEAGHREGFGSAPGGQLVQETDVFAAVRGARIVLADDDGTRAPITAHWLAQMGWEVAWIDGPAPAARCATGPWHGAQPVAPAVERIAPAELAALQADGGVLLIDLARSAAHVAAHIPGAWWALRTQLPRLLDELPARSHIVLTCETGALAGFAAADLARLTDTPVRALEGGNAGWHADARALEAGAQRLASPRIDRYRRPYEGADNAREAMQAYLEWEYGLVAQLGRDATHGFKVLAAA